MVDFALSICEIMGELTCCDLVGRAAGFKEDKASGVLFGDGLGLKRAEQGCGLPRVSSVFISVGSDLSSSRREALIASLRWGFVLLIDMICALLSVSPGAAGFFGGGKSGRE